MGQIWQFNTTNFSRESVGKVSGSIVKLDIDGRSETLSVVTSTNLIIQLVLGEKKMRKKIGLNIRKNKEIRWNVQRFSTSGLGFISEQGVVTFVDLRRKKVEKINAEFWLGENCKLRDWSVDRDNSRLSLLAGDGRLVILENRNQMKSMGPNDWNLVRIERVAEVSSDAPNEYEFFDENAAQKQGLAILGSFGKKVVLRDFSAGEVIQINHHKISSTIAPRLNLNIILESPNMLKLAKDSQEIRLESKRDFHDFKWINSRLVIHRWRELAVLDEQTLSGLFRNSQTRINFEELVTDIQEKSQILQTGKQMSWFLELKSEYKNLKLTQSGFVILDSNHRLKLFDLRGKLQDEVRVDCKSPFDQLTLSAWRDSLLIGFNQKSYKIFKIHGGSLRLFLGGVTLQSIRDAVAQAYPHQKWRIISSKFSAQLDRIGCLLSANDESAIAAILSLSEGKLGLLELDLELGQVPAEILFDQREESIFGVRVTSDRKRRNWQETHSTDFFKMCLMNSEGQIKKMDSVAVERRVQQLEYPRLKLRNEDWKGAGILEGHSGEIGEEVRIKCVEFSRAITEGKVERALELAEELDRRIEGRVLEKMMELCFLKKNAKLAECTLNKMKFLRGKVLLSESTDFF